MYIDKAKALRAGAILLGAFFLIVLTTLITFHMSAAKDMPAGGADNVNATEFQTDTDLPFAFVGSWYADTDDSDILVLAPDGSYTSSTWLRDGRYEASANVLTLTDSLGGTKTLHFVPEHSSGAPALVYSDLSPVRTYYADKETMIDHKKTAEDTAALTSDVNQRNLMMILSSGAWNGKTVNGDATVDITDTTITITEGTLETDFVYSLSNVLFDKNSQTFSADLLSSADRTAQTIEGAFAYVKALSVHLEDNDSYTLYFLDGSSFGFEYRPFVKTVKLTLEPALDASAGNCEQGASSPAPGSQAASAASKSELGALPPSDATGVAEDPDNWDATGTKMIVSRESITADDGTVTTTTTYADGSIETQISHQTTIESGDIDLSPKANEVR